MAVAKEDILLRRLLFHSDSDDTGDLVRMIQERPDWVYVTEQAAIEQISPLIYYRIKSLRLDRFVPPAIFQALEKRYLANLARNLVILGEAKRVLGRFRAEGVDLIALKGLALAECVYPHFALRQMSDVDILVRKESVRQVNRIMADLSYGAVDNRPEQALQNPAGYLASLEYRKNASGFLAFHIHWHLVNTTTPAGIISEGIDLERVWERAVAARIADVETKILAPPHQVIFLCEHALRAGHSFDRLILIHDIHSVIRQQSETIDWQELVSEGRTLGLSHLVHAGLSVIGHYAPGSIPDGVVERARPDSLSICEKIFLFLQCRNIRTRGLSILVYLGMHRGISAKAGFIFRIIFPPASVIAHKAYGARDRKTGIGRYASRMREITTYALSAVRHFFCVFF